MWTDLSKWAKNSKILRSHVNVQHKVTLVEEKFNNQGDDWPILWTVGLFPQPSLLLLNGSMNEVAMVAEMGVLYMGSATLMSTHQNWPGYRCCWVPALPTADTNTEFQMWHHSLGWPVTWWQVDYVGSLPLLKEQCFVLTGIDTYFGYGFAFLCIYCFFQNLHIWTYGMLYPP